MRIWLLVGLLVPLTIVTATIRRIHRPEAHTIATPAVSLASVPSQLGLWQVRAAQLPGDVFESLGAVDSINLHLSHGQPSCGERRHVDGQGRRWHDVPPPSRSIATPLRDGTSSNRESSRSN